MEAHPILSKLTRLKIKAQQVFDHAYRNVTGLPQVKRSLITPNLYVGGQYNLNGLERLYQRGVTGIVNMRMHSIHKEVDHLDVKLLNLPTPDQHAPTQEHLQKGVIFIQNEIHNGGKVYIHCMWGEGRGPTMAIAYFISTGLTFQDAYELVRKVRTFIHPTGEQIEALKTFEKSLCSANK